MNTPRPKREWTNQAPFGQGESGMHILVDRIDLIIDAVEALTKQQVLIGIPAEGSERDSGDGQEINNAQIGYIQEFGEPSKNIPARAHLVPGVQAYLPKALERMKAAGNASFDGKTEIVAKQLNSTGLEAVTSVKDAILALPPYSEDSKTIYARRHRHTKPIRMGLAALIDLADYIRHITYVIRKVK